MKLDLRFVVLALGIAVVAAFVAWPSCARRPGAGPGAIGDDGDEGDDASAGGGGIGRREAMAAAVGTVSAEIVDGDGMPLSGGTAVLRCLLGDGDVRSIEGGVVEIDEAGELHGPGCRGEVCVELRHAGYVPTEPWVLTPQDPAVLHARPLGRLHGEVVDPTGNAVVAASIVVTAVPGSDPTGVLPFTSSATTSDEDGVFSLAWVERPPCDPCRERTGQCSDGPLPTLDEVLLTVRADGFGPAERTVALDELGEDPIRVAMPAPAEPIRGTLVDAHGSAYARAFVLARSVARPAEQQRADVDDDGRFVLDGLGEGTYDLRAIQDGLVLDRAEGVAVGGTVMLVGPGQRDLVVEVVDADDAPVARAQVSGGPFDGDRTDDEGRVRAARVALGSYPLRVRPPRQAAAVHTVEVTAADAAPDPARNPTQNPTQITRIRASSPPPR